MGSVKDLTILQEPTKYKMGLGRFKFSDRYSVFDWGEMPDHLRNKGASLCAMSAYFFELLDKLNVPSHYIGVSNGGYATKLFYLDGPPTSMMIQLARVIKPRQIVEDETVTGYDYSPVQEEEHRNFVIPLEVIYRNSLPKGSSVFKRLKEGTLTLEEIGLTEMPIEGQRLSGPFIDASTKYEEFDRYPGWNELQRLAGLADEESERMQEYVLLANDLVTREMRRAGFSNEDGKFEFAFDDAGLIIMADTIGTLDECRFYFNGVDVSKQIARDWYTYSQPGWKQEIEDAKKASKKNWKQQVASRPEPLPVELKEMLENLYQSIANTVIGVQIFSGVPAVSEVVQEYKQFKEANMRS